MFSIFKNHIPFTKIGVIMFPPILGPVAINLLNAEGDILSADYGNCAYHVQQGM